MSSAPRLAPSSRNCRAATPTLSAAVAPTVTELPATVALADGVERVAVGAVVSGPEVTVSEKLVVRVTPPPTAVTVVMDVPSGEDAAAVSVSPVAHEGEHEPGLKEAVTPEGRPAAVKETAVALPADNVAVTVVAAVEPLATDRLPVLPSAKSKEAGGSSPRPAPRTQTCFPRGRMRRRCTSRGSKERGRSRSREAWCSNRSGRRSGRHDIRRRRRCRRKPPTRG